MTHARSCCCDPDGPIYCEDEPIPTGCFLLTVNGIAAATCDAPAGTFQDSVVTDMSVSIATVVSFDGISAPHFSSPPLQRVVCRIENRTSDGEVSDFFFYCQARINISMGCIDGVWSFGVSVNLYGQPCNTSGGVQGFSANLFSGGLTSQYMVPIGGSQSNLNTNEFSCVFPGIGGSATMRRVTSCTPPETKVIARSCDGLSEITVDPNDDRPDTFGACYFEGVLYKLTSEPSEDPAVEVSWVDEQCEGPQIDYPTLIRCDGQSGRITYDPDDRGDGMLTAIFDGVSWYDDGLTSQDEPSSVVWTSDPCPTIGDEQLWERCRVDGEFYRPGEFYGVELPPNRVRIVNEITTSEVAMMTVVGRSYQVAPGEWCRDIMAVHYRLIPDDGGSYLTVGAGIPVAASCGETRDRFLRGFCGFDADAQPDDPTRPGFQTPEDRGSDTQVIRSRPAEQIPDDFDPGVERRRLRSGGCCGQPSRD